RPEVREQLERQALFEAGKAFEARTGRQLDAIAPHLGEQFNLEHLGNVEFEVLHQVPVEPIVGYKRNGQPIYGERTILDHLVVAIDEFGEATPLVAIEDKLTHRTFLTENQQKGFPAINKNGFRTVSRKHDATIEYGTVFDDPLGVLVIRGD